MKFFLFVITTLFIISQINAETKFTIVWPPTWLYSSKIKEYNYTNNYFTIHGIWPNKTCNSTEKFNLSKLHDIYDELDIYWTNFINTTQFLEHEFYKHLSCYPQPYSMFYFGLELLKNITLFNNLYTADIIPSKNYSTDEIHKAINYIYNVDVNIVQDNGMLDEVEFCFDDELTTMQDCLEYYPTTNTDVVYYETYN